MSPIFCRLLLIHSSNFPSSFSSFLPPFLLLCFSSFLFPSFHLSSSSIFGSPPLLPIHSSPLCHLSTHLSSIHLSSSFHTIIHLCPPFMHPSTELLVHPPFSIHSSSHPLTQLSIYCGLNVKCPPLACHYFLLILCM